MILYSSELPGGFGRLFRPGRLGVLGTTTSNGDANSVPAGENPCHKAA